VGGETGLMLRLAFGRPWRQTEGLLGSIMDLRLAEENKHEGSGCGQTKLRRRRDRQVVRGGTLPSETARRQVLAIQRRQDDAVHCPSSHNIIS
jgi:hypothetical protein